MRQAGRYLPEYRELRSKAPDFLTFCFTPDLAVEATLQPIRRFGFDAAIIFSDILTVPHALGRRVWFVEGEGPRLDPLSTGGDIAALRTEGATAALATVYEAITAVRRALPPETALIGFAGSPWTVACYMVAGAGSKHFEPALALARDDEQHFSRLIEVLADVTADHLIQQIRAGAGVVQLFDSWAGLVPSGAFDRWVIDPTRRIVEQVRAAVGPDVPIIGFPRAVGDLYGRYVRDTGVTAVSLDPTLSPDAVARLIPDSVAVQGNLDPEILLGGGEPLDRAIDAILDGFGRRPFVFNLGHGVLPPTPIAHVERLVDRVRRSLPSP